MQMLYEAREASRCQNFKAMHLHSPLIRLTGATIECKRGLVIVRDAVGHEGMIRYRNERQRRAIIDEIERARRAEQQGLERKYPLPLDRPPWGMYMYEMVPAHGPRRGTPAEDPDFGYFLSERDAEPWAEYFKRCGVRL